ncbi:ribonuclease H [Physcia stellaris]|nr:ribonuclease H [Physcia stellaris]
MPSKPFIMTIHVDGGCRNNGRASATGAAAAVFYNRNGFPTTWTRRLNGLQPPTSQRAELTAIVLALEQVLVKHAGLRRNPRLRVTIYTDSKYVLGCMTGWYEKWVGNGWRNAKGGAVANRDLVEWAKALEGMVREVARGTVRFVWVPRERNGDADRAVGAVLDGI